MLRIMVDLRRQIVLVNLITHLVSVAAYPTQPQGHTHFDTYNVTTRGINTNTGGHHTGQDAIVGGARHRPMYFTPEQYNQLLRILTKDNTSSASTANMAGIIRSFMATCINPEWIVDTGATDHMVSSSKMMSEKHTPDSESGTVHLPNGSQLPIAHVGKCKLIQGEISGVLCVPGFKYNILSVSKLTKELNCCMAFFPDFCLMQDLHTGKVTGTGRLLNELYYWDHKQSNKMAHSVVLHVRSDEETWLPHKILK